MIMILTVFNFGFQTYQSDSSVFECRENRPSGNLKALINEVLRPPHYVVLLVLNLSLPLFLNFGYLFSAGYVRGSNRIRQNTVCSKQVA